MATREEAKKIVLRLSKKYGYLSQEIMEDIEQWKPEYRRAIDEAFLERETKATQPIQMLAKQIYESGALFVFELLQNADDNHYQKIRNTGAIPSILFQVHSDRIVVECNEDGFSSNDVEAICNVGKSTKSGWHGYIGAKRMGLKGLGFEGFGFKSVFIAAWRVYIQSGNFSFEFKHKKGDLGLGMVRPLWVDDGDAVFPPGPLTRMTLYLHENGDPKEMISEQLDDLEPSCLLFLSTLQQIDVQFFDEEGKLQNSKRFRKLKINDHCVSLETTHILSGGESTTQNQIYHITTENATNLPPSENRHVPAVYSMESQRILTTAEVVLAFPLSEEFEPIIDEEHEVFSFLPVQESHYDFIIHSDFDTSANRENIITTSKRNCALLQWIAAAFIKSVWQFCEHPTLCYDWPLFLPYTRETDTVFWGSLDKTIREKISMMPIFRSNNKGYLRRMKDVVTVTRDSIYESGQPVLDDPVGDPFMSIKYSLSAKTILWSYGLCRINISLWLDLLELDLKRDHSVIRSEDMSDEGHSIVAKLLYRWHENQNLVKRIKSLPLLPLRDGKWVRANSEGSPQQIYFPTTNGVTIPEDLEINVISPSAVANPDRMRLFEVLGVITASVTFVRSIIVNSYGKSLHALPSFKPCLEYLYLTHSSEEEPSLITVLSNQSKALFPRTTDVYFLGTTNPYSPEALLGDNPELLPPEVNFLNSIYMSLPPDRPTSNHPTWEEWLCEFIGIRTRLRLTTSNGGDLELSSAVEFVLKHHADKFLGLFEDLWAHETASVKASLAPKIRDSLPSQHLCGVDFELPLKETWIPMKYLRETIVRYMEHPESFPFLKFEEKHMDEEQFCIRWKFLSNDFAVRNEDNLDFLLTILHHIQRSCPKPSSTQQIQKVFDLYMAIHAKFAVTSDEETDRKSIQEFFSCAGVIIPDGDGSTWAKSSDCFWSSPCKMVFKYPLENLYSRTLGTEQMRVLKDFFCGTLCIPPITLNDMVSELSSLRENGCRDRAQVHEVYSFLNKLPIEPHNLSNVFAKNRLIYAEPQSQPGWFQTYQCLWSSSTPIRGMVVLDSLYSNLQEFFVNKLGVRRPTMYMVYNELQAPQQRNMEEVRATLFAFNNLLEEEDSAGLDPDPVLEASILPVRHCNGNPVLRSAKSEFAIGDRVHLRRRFADKITLLDFDLDEVCRLKPFFEWADLEGHYMSKLVKQDTQVSGDPGRPIISKNRDLKRKAYHILRIAATFNSPRFQTDPSGTYHLLRSAEVVETNNISLTLTMYQNDNQISVNEAARNEHIIETPSGLTIYVPRKRKAQDISFFSALPRKFAGWLMKHPTSNVDDCVDIELTNILTAVFSSEKSALDEILDRHGIVEVSIQNEDLESDEEDEEDSDDEVQGNTTAEKSPITN